MGTPRLQLPGQLEKRGYPGQVDEFYSYTDTQMWTKLVADTNTTVAVDTTKVDGVLKLFTGDLTDNNEASVRSTNKQWKITANQGLMAEAGIQYTEGNTDDANIAFGFSSVIGANWLVDNGAGPATTQDAAMIYKVDGGTVWKCCSQIGTNQTISTSTTTAGGNQTLRVEVTAQPGGTADVAFFVKDTQNNGGEIQLIDSTSLKPIKHTILAGDVSSATAMYLGAYVKAGGTAANETLYVDYMGWSKTRDR